MIRKDQVIKQLISQSAKDIAFASIESEVEVGGVKIRNESHIE